jgi:hypothetical protein
MPLRTVVFERGSTLHRIGESFFANCSSKSAEIPRSVEVLDEASFCGNLEFKGPGQFVIHYSKVESLTFERTSGLRPSERKT